MPKGGFRVGAGRPKGSKSVNTKPRKMVLTPRAPKVKPVVTAKKTPTKPAKIAAEPTITPVEPESTPTVPETNRDNQAPNSDVDMIQPEDYRFEGWEDFALYVLNAPNSEVPMADKIRAMQALSASENRRKTASGEKTKEKRAAEKSSRDGAMSAGSKFAPRNVT